ncbi:MAG TPA: sigma-54-dependent Fis family transcriptional regulator [Pseudomonadota bacterium]|nr:sigma-54-dependent Fis family transcriptional regulator [Pseudomonadota bacterium]
MTDSSVLLIEGQKKHEQILQPGQDMYICRTELVGSDKPHKDDRDARRRGEDSGVSAITEISPAQRRFTTHSPYISQNHAVLSLTPGGKFTVKDLDSANGTWLRLPPHQVYELPENFELLLAKDLVVQRRTPLWETTPEIGRFANGDDFAAYVRSQLSNYVASVRIYSKESPENQRDNQLCTKLPLLAQPCNPEPSYLAVTWRNNTFNLALERWLQSCVFLFNSGPVGDHSPLRDEKPWQFVAASPDRKHVLRLAQRAALTAGTVLLYGPSGAGKEVLARDLHLHSSRAKKPFIAVNCAALPADLIEAELFGTKRGAFTNAVDRIGLFERARDGTLFLDEIGELPLNLQAKLLRALDQKVIRCVGDVEERPIKARIIAATNRNLEKMVAAGTFRDDLRFRLVAVQLTLPGLQPSDVTALVPHLYETLEDEGFAELSEETVQTISKLAAQISWSGNARELRSALERYLTFRDPASTVEENWKKAIQSSWPITQSSGVVPPAQIEPTPELPETLGQDCERLQNLLFLSVARRVLIPHHWGSLKELGDKMGMTGAGAAARLRRLAISTDPEPSAAQIDAEIAALQAELQPRMALLRSLLGL